MSKTHLRVFRGPETVQHVEEACEPNMVRVPFGEIYPLLADAVRNRRTWLHDFDHDELVIPTDLYEMLLAYQFSRRPSA